MITLLHHPSPPPSPPHRRPGPCAARFPVRRGAGNAKPRRGPGRPDGATHRLQLFHAQRQHGLGIFRIRTNIIMSDNGARPSINGILED